MTNPNEPTKEEMLEWFDNTCVFLSLHGWTRPISEAIAIRALIESGFTAEEMKEVVTKLCLKIEELQKSFAPKVVTQNHAELCPVCSGSGKIAVNLNPASTSRFATYNPCHGCAGVGWVIVKNMEEEKP